MGVVFFAGVKITMPTHQKFASAIFLFSAKSKGSTAPFAAHALLAFFASYHWKLPCDPPGFLRKFS